LPVPTTDNKIEGRHSQPWILTEASQPIAMGPDAFFDGSSFDPAQAEAIAEAYRQCPVSPARRSGG